MSPIYKTEAKNDCGNYRPISVLSIIAKIFEKIIDQQLYTYLQENNILSSQQAGFRKIIQHKHPCYVLPTTG